MKYKKKSHKIELTPGGKYLTGLILGTGRLLIQNIKNK
jgi:hypothetical protein